MQNINEITIEHIQSLKDIQLSKLLLRLLEIESAKYSLLTPDILVPFNITTSDGGNDGHIKWDSGPDRTKHLQNRYIVFQNKATDLGPSKCYEEILVTKKENQSLRELKPSVKRVVEASGSYTLFTTQALNENQKLERTKKFREAIRDAGHANYITFQIEIYDANKIKDWTNEFIEAVTMVQEFNGISRPLSFRTLDELKTHSKIEDTPFQINESTTSYIDLIQSEIISAKAVRIFGHSGLGKTRLVYEALKPTTTGHSKIIGIIYYDLGLVSDPSALTNYIISHQGHQYGTIIIDNCDALTHKTLSGIVSSHGGFKIITIGFDDDRAIEDAKIKLDRKEQENIVGNIIDQKLGFSHSLADRSYVRKISEGYPWMAVKFCDGIISHGMSNLTQYSLDDFIRKLLFSTDEGDVEYEIICACAIFSAFGFLDDSFSSLIKPELAVSLQAQMDFIRTKVYDGELTETTFRKICLKFKQLDIIEQRGIYYIVKPTVLAIHLAAYWMTVTPRHRIVTVIESLKNFQLDEKFLERLTDLDQLDKAKDIVNELWGENSFFGSAEVINSEWGSLLFRYVVEVNPDSTVETLKRVFSGLDTASLRRLTQSRRNLVWALEKLVFRKEIFESAAPLLYRLAVAENENWSNNATNQFVHLFQLYLPGTEAPLTDRISVIKWGLKQSESEFTRIGIDALSNGLVIDRFMRGGRAESQGSGAPLRDYEPSSYQEIYDYWQQIVDLLIIIAKSNTEYLIQVKKAIVKGIRSFTKFNQTNLLQSAIENLVLISNEFWPDAIHELKVAIAYDHAKEETSAILKSLIDKLTPQDLSTKLYLSVTKPEYIHEDEDDLSGARQLGKIFELVKLIKEENLPIEKHFKQLLQGNHQLAFSFGEQLATILDKPYESLSLMFDELIEIPVKDQNSEFLVGFIKGCNNEEITKIALQRMLNTKEAAHHAFFAVRVLKVSFDEIIRLFEAIKKYDLSIVYFSSLQYGDTLKSYTSLQIIELADLIKDFGLEGRWTAFLLLDAYRDRKPGINSDLDHYLEELISEVNMLKAVDQISTIQSFQWGEIVSLILNQTGKSDFAKIIMGQIIEIYSTYSLSNSFSNLFPKIIRKLLSNYFDDIWDIFGSALLSKNFVFILKVQMELGAKNGWNSSVGVLFENNEINNKIIEWVKSHPEIAPRRIAKMMPIFDQQESGQLHPFARIIIDNFGSQQSVIDEFSANLASYSMVGSTLEYYEGIRELLNQLRDHQISSVKEWANKSIKEYERKISEEKLEDDSTFE